MTLALISHYKLNMVQVVEPAPEFFIISIKINKLKVDTFAKIKNTFGWPVIETKDFF